MRSGGGRSRFRGAFSWVSPDSQFGELKIHLHRAAGILVRRQGLGESQAIAQLRRHAVKLGRELREVEESVVSASRLGVERKSA